MSRLTERGRRTRERILRAATALFSTKGFGRTSVDDVLEASGTGKSQFYHYFENKADLVCTVLREQRREGRPGLQPFESWKGMATWFDRLLDAVEASGDGGRDMIGASAVDLVETDGALRKEIVRTMHLRRRLLFRGLRRMKKRGLLTKDAEPARLAAFAAAAIEGGLHLASSEGTTAPLRDALVECRKHLDRYRADG